MPKKTEIIPKSYIGAIAGYAIPSEVNYGSGFKYGGSLCLGITKNIAIELSGLRFQSNVEGDPEGLSEGKLSFIPIQLSIEWGSAKRRREKGYKAGITINKK